MVSVCVSGYQGYPRSGTVYSTCKPESGHLVSDSTSRSCTTEYALMYNVGFVCEYFILNGVVRKC